MGNTFIPSKVGLLTFVDNVETVDMGIEAFFPKQQVQALTDGEFLQYDVREVKGRQRQFNSFRNSANIKTSGGYSTVTVAPYSINFGESLTKVLEKVKRFGETVYDGNIQKAQKQVTNETSAELHLDGVITRKFATYEALVFHKITNAYEGIDGFQDIAMAVPDDNLEFLDNSAGNEYWTNVDAPIVTQLGRTINKMLIKPTTIILNRKGLKNLMANKSIKRVVKNADGTLTEGNYVAKDLSGINRDVTTFFKHGSIQDDVEGVYLDVWVEEGTGNDKTGTEKPFMPDGYVSFLKKGLGETLFGGIPRVSGNGISYINKEYDVFTDIKEANPIKFDLIYQSLCLPLLKNGNGFYTMKTTA